jgi:oligo-1,6-glucosidase
MVRLREKTPALVYGDYKDLDPLNAHVFAYTRTLGSEKYLVVMNFSGKEVAYALPGGMKAGSLVISNLGASEEKVSLVKLKGWEARVYRQ